MNLSRLILPLLFLAPLAGVRADTYDFKESVTHSGAFAKSGKLTLENVNGSVEIGTWDKNEIRVEAEKSAATDEELKLIELTVDLSEADAAIKVRLPNRPSGWFGNKGIRAAVKFKVTVPASARLEKISVVNAGVTIDGVHGAVNASSVNGAVRARRLGGDARLSTVNGSVNAEFEQVAAHQKLSFSTVNGGLLIRLPKDTGAELKASVVNGRVSCTFPLELNGKISSKNISGRIGDGRASLEARSVNGGVRIEQL